MENLIYEKIMEHRAWQPPMVPKNISRGDMPGDKVEIGESHVTKANIIFPELLKEMQKLIGKNGAARIVISVCGGSGVGKSGIASVLSFYLQNMGIGSYTLSGDNYPRRIPKCNDAERLHLFREAALKGMIQCDEYAKDRFALIQKWQKAGDDANPAYAHQYYWFTSYLDNGRKGLEKYLGTDKEINFAEVSSIIEKFKNGAPQIWLKRMGRTETELWYENVDFSKVQVLMIEWTHGNSDYFKGVDIPVFLNSTPQETLEYRRARNRDGATSSPFTMLVLEIEQELLESQAHKAKIILSKNGELLTYQQYCKLMENSKRTL